MVCSVSISKWKIEKETFCYLQKGKTKCYARSWKNHLEEIIGLLNSTIWRGRRVIVLGTFDRESWLEDGQKLNEKFAFRLHTRKKKRKKKQTEAVTLSPTPKCSYLARHKASKRIRSVGDAGDVRRSRTDRTREAIAIHSPVCPFPKVFSSR